jgi:hypothetical protein
MDSQEFNEKWADYLEEGHYGCDLSNERIIDFIDGIMEDLTKIEGFEFAQIKQKFHFHCFYAKNISRAMNDLITEEMSRIEDEDNG